MNGASLCLAALVVARCGLGGAPAASSAERTAVKLLDAAPELETTQRTQLRTDVAFDVRDQEPAAMVVAKGEVGPLERSGRRARLCGDAGCTRGIEVDNVVLLEVAGPDGHVSARAVVGFTDGLTFRGEGLDLLGRRAFAFEPDELDVTHLVPEDGPFRLRATALDNHGVGRVSEVWLVLEPIARAGDDLRNE